MTLRYPSMQELLTATPTGAGFDVYDYAQVGAGLSERLEDVRDYTVARHVADLEAIRADIGADRLVLVGGSVGRGTDRKLPGRAPRPRSQGGDVLAGAELVAGVRGHERADPSGRQDQHAAIADGPRFMLAHVLPAHGGPAGHPLATARQADGRRLPVRRRPHQRVVRV